MCLAFLALPLSAYAQTSLCGEAPPVKDSHLKGEIEGKAQFLSRFLGDASLGGKVEQSKTEIFSRYKDADERSKAYFDYEVCILLMQDKSMTTTQKIETLSRFRHFSATPVATGRTELREGPNVNFGCADNGSSPVSYAAPTGFHIVNANAAVVASDNTQSASAKVVSQDQTSATAVAEFRGRDRDWTGNCPGGGHGAVRITVEIAPNQAS